MTRICHKYRPLLCHLNLRGCSQLSSDSLKAIGYCQNLQDLNLSETQGINVRINDYAIDGRYSMGHVLYICRRKWCSILEKAVLDFSISTCLTVMSQTPSYDCSASELETTPPNCQITPLAALFLQTFCQPALFESCPFPQLYQQRAALHLLRQRLQTSCAPWPLWLHSADGWWAWFYWQGLPYPWDAITGWHSWLQWCHDSQVGGALPYPQAHQFHGRLKTERQSLQIPRHGK